MGDRSEDDEVEQAMRAAARRRRSRSNSRPRLRRGLVEDDGEDEKGAPAGHHHEAKEPEGDLVAEAVQERAAWGGLAPVATEAGRWVLRKIAEAWRRDDPDQLPQAPRHWIARSQADTVVTRSVEFLETELAAERVLVLAGDVQAVEASVRGVPTFGKLTRIRDKRLRDAAALTAHGWVLPLILYHQIHEGKRNDPFHFCAGTPVEDEGHHKLLRRVLERARYHAILLGEAVNLGILDPDVPWYQHNLAVVLRLAKHGEFLDRMLELQTLTPGEGIAAGRRQLEEFDERATAVLLALVDSLPTGAVEDPEPRFLRDNARWVRAFDLVAPRWTGWIMPLVQLGAVAMPTFLEIMEPVVRYNTPAGLRARDLGTAAIPVLDRENFNREVATELNAHPAKDELLGRMVYAQDNGAHKVYVTARGEVGVSATSLGHETQHSIRANRVVGARNYPDMLEVGSVEGLARLIHVNATKAGLYSQFTSVPMCIMADANLAVACDGLLSAKAEFGAGRTAEAQAMVNLHGASLTKCAERALLGANLPEDQHVLVRAFVDFQVGAWLRDFHFWTAMPEAMALHTAGYFLHHHLKDTVSGIPWWTDALLPGTPANTMLVTNYCVYWIGRQIAQLATPRMETMNFEQFVWWCIRGYTKVTHYWNAPAAAGYVAYNWWWGTLDAWVVPRFVLDLGLYPARGVQACVQAVRTELRTRLPTITGLRAWREATLRAWRVSGMERVFGHLARLEPEMKLDYEAGADALNAAVEGPVARNVARVANTIAAAPSATNVPLTDFNTTMNHMHEALESYQVIPVTQAVVNAATKAVIATVVIESLGVTGAALVTQYMVSQAYDRVPAAAAWRSYLGSRAKALPKLLYRGFARCLGRRAPPRLPSDKENLAFEGPLESVDYAERVVDPLRANDRINDEVGDQVATQRRNGATEAEIDAWFRRQNDPFVLDLWRKNYKDRGPPPPARARLRDVGGEIQEFVDGNRRFMSMAEIRTILADNRDYRPYLVRFDQGAFGRW